MAIALGPGKRGPEINVTPLIDVLLVLIIIFMVIQPMQHTVGLTAQVPQPPDHSKPQRVEDTVIVQVMSRPENGSSLRINQEEVSWDDLGARLSGIYDLRADKGLVCKG